MKFNLRTRSWFFGPATGPISRTLAASLMGNCPSATHMDVFDLNRAVIKQYKGFTRSCSKIRSADSAELSEKVNVLYDVKSFWPDPLIPLNPHYADGCTVRDFIESGDLEPECAELFPSFSDAGGSEDTMRLRKHQGHAVSLALHRKSFVVTTGTGSGKSLCFFIPIINSAIRE